MEIKLKKVSGKCFDVYINGEHRYFLDSTKEGVLSLVGDIINEYILSKIDDDFDRYLNMYTGEYLHYIEDDEDDILIFGEYNISYNEKLLEEIINEEDENKKARLILKLVNDILERINKIEKEKMGVAMELKVKEIEKGTYMVKFGEKELVFKTGYNLVKLLEEFGYRVDFDTNMNDYYVYKDGELLFIIDYESMILKETETIDLFHFIENLLWMVFLINKEEGKRIKEVEIKISEK